VLAGSRGPTDPVAKAKGLAHKAMVPVYGVPMLERVVNALLAVPSIEHIILSADPALKSEGFGPVLTPRIEAGGITLAEPQSSPSASVASVLDQLSPESFPLLVTTADHPLLTPSMIEHFWTNAEDQGDLVIGLAEAATIRAVYPNAVRTFYRFGDQRFSGCNLFVIASPRARNVVSFWQEMEHHRKRPWRLIAAIGVMPLLRFLINQLTIGQALSHLGRLVDARIGMVAMPQAEAAIDVDKPDDLRLVEEILGARS
jgi:GTP:adenosylcobinamide-phosphate guanylyltransferase